MVQAGWEVLVSSLEEELLEVHGIADDVAHDYTGRAASPATKLVPAVLPRAANFPRLSPQTMAWHGIANAVGDLIRTPCVSARMVIIGRLRKLASANLGVHSLVEPMRAVLRAAGSWEYSVLLQVRAVAACHG